MVWKNIGPQQWMFHCTLSGTNAQSGIFDETVRSLNTWFVPYGQPYSPGVRCIKVGQTIKQYDPAGTPTWSFDWQVPASWDGVPGGTVGPFVGNITLDVLIIATNWGVYVDPACNWELQFDQIEILYSVNGGPYVSVKIIGPHTESGANWDARYCSDEVRPSTSYAVSLPGSAPGCRTAKVLEPVGSISASTTCDWGWRHHRPVDPWIYDDDLWEYLHGPSVCACYYAPLSIGEHPDSWHNTVTVDSSYSYSTVDGASGHWPGDGIDCPPFDWTSWINTEEFRNRVIGYGRALPKNFGVKAHRRQIDSTCNGVADYHSDVTTNDILTTCSYQTITTHTIGHHTCISLIPVGCPSPIPSVSDFCSYSETDEISWPTAPPCFESDRNPSYDVSFGHRHVVGWIR